MEKDQQKIADAIGLSEYQAKLYFAGLCFNQATISSLARKAGIPRTAAYEPIESLIKQGFISVTKVNKRKYYKSVDPKKLLTIFEGRKSILKESIKNITQKIDASSEDLAVTYYPGVAGLLTAGKIFLEESNTKLWKTFENPEAVLKEVGVEYNDHYMAERINKGIFGRVIMPGKNLSGVLKNYLKKDKEQLRETLLISPDLYPIESSIAVADDMVIMFSALNEPITLLIKNKQIANTISSIHDMIWDRYKARPEQ